MSATQLRDRAAWLAHVHVCAECERRQPCGPGRELIELMRAGLSAEESLPAWM